jgi:hypothetical protein
MNTITNSTLENSENLKRNVTISTKVSALEKIELQQLANGLNISRAELFYSLVHNYKYHYNYIGRQSPMEEKLADELEEEKKQNRKLTISLENAEHRVQIERELNKKLERSIFDLNRTLDQFKENMKTKDRIFEELMLTNQKQEEKLDKMDKKNDRVLYYSSLGAGILTGLSIIFLPFILKD